MCEKQLISIEMCNQFKKCRDLKLWVKYSIVFVVWFPIAVFLTVQAFLWSFDTCDETFDWQSESGKHTKFVEIIFMLTTQK